MSWASSSLAAPILQSYQLITILRRRPVPQETWPMFTWKPIYIELAQKLLDYRNNQRELLAWLQAMKQAGLPAISIADFKPEGKAIGLSGIDPFTFFANFNRAIKTEHRVEILRTLKNRMGLAAALPDDFDGVPVANSQKAWFFPKAYEREPETIPLLWDLANDVVTHDPSSLSADLFEKCLLIKQVGLPKLTMGMFWLQPDRYVALDQVNRAYLLEKYDFTAKTLKAKTLDQYLDILKSIGRVTPFDPPRLSSDAYTHGLKVDLDLRDVDRGFQWRPPPRKALRASSAPSWVL